jgi:hypothetical protein
MRRKAAHLTASAAVVAVLALGAAGCKTTSDEVTGSVGSSAAPRNEGEWRRSLDVWANRYRDNQSDPDVAINYAQALRATEQRAQASRHAFALTLADLLALDRHRFHALAERVGGQERHGQGQDRGDGGDGGTDHR